MSRKPRDTLPDASERATQPRLPANKSPARPPKLPEGRSRPRSPDEDVTVVNLISDASPTLAVALQRCLTNPEELSAWDALEGAAEARAETQHVAELYRATLQRHLPVALLLELGARAVRFHDEWAPGDEALIALLVRVLEIDPTVKWAFDRVSLELTMRARGDELLGLYDRVLAAVGEGPRLIALLEEAADVARESAGQVDRAIGYLERLFAADPRRESIAASLERLLTQQRRHKDLLSLWTRRMEIEGPPQAARLRCRAAAFCVEQMADAAAALAALAPLEGEPAEAEAVCALLEKIVQAPSASMATRREALARLRSRHDAAGRSVDMVRPLRAALGRAEGTDVASLHGEIARRLVDAGQDAEATPHLAAFVSLDPVACDDALLDRLLGETLEGPIAGCSPRFDREARRELVRQAAMHAAAGGGGQDRAIRLYQRLLCDLPGDAQIILALGELYRTGERHAALVELRRHELGLATDVAQRQALRVEVARLHLLLADTGSAVAVLRENLDEQPSDEETIAAVVRTLETNGRLKALCDVLEEHATKVVGWGPRIAVGLWSKAAEIAEHRLSDARRAMRDHEHVVAVSPEPASLDALGRINTELGDHRAAAGWLKELVACARPEERATDVFRLASAYIAIGQSADALASIETFLRVDPRDLRLRMMQIDLRRASGDLEALVTALVDAAPHADPVVACSLLREAAKVLTRDLDAPARAVPLLERVVALRSTDVAARIELADVLHHSGQRVEARRMAKAILAEFGRRHPPERAGLHLLLGRVAHEQGEGLEALKELEAAVGMDVGNPAAQLMLGKVSREVGQLDRAERAFHALLLLQRRGDASARDRPPMSETLVELHRLATLRGNTERAAENLASAFDAATRSEHEARGLERALREAEMPALLLQALESHLTRVEEPAARAALLAESAAALGALGRDDEALDVALLALSLAPGDARVHDRAQEACARAAPGTDKAKRYVETLQGLIAKALESGDGVIGCSLLLRLGDVYEADPGQLDAAEAVYAQAEDTSENILEVWRRRARLAARRGDRDTSLKVLRKLADSASELAPGERADTLYALAELELQTSDGVDAGLASLGLALEAEPRPDKAAASLKAALEVAADHEPIARLYESVARAHGDDGMLLDALSVTSSLPNPTQALLREAYEVSDRVAAKGEPTSDRSRRLLERAVLMAREGGDPADALWAMRELVVSCERQGDIRGALSWVNEAALVAEPDEAAQLLTQGAAFATTLGDVDGALDCYERLLGTDPSDPSLWGAMLALLRKNGDVARLDGALIRAADESRDPEERNRLRMERARLLRASQTSEAKGTLHAVLDEQPEHAEAAELLSQLLDPERERDELVALLTRRLEVAREGSDAEAATALALRLAEVQAGPDALDVVRETLGWIPTSAALLRRLVELLDPASDSDAVERADALERLLDFEEGPQRLARAIELVRARIAMGDADAVERVLEHVTRADPEHPEIAATLGWLAKARIAEAAERPDESVRLLRAAAQIQDRLGDPDAALETLDQAQAARPDDLELLALRARRLLDAGRGDDAIAMISEAVLRSEERAEPNARAERLAVRAKLWTARGDHASALRDLEEATLHGGDRWLRELLAALESARELASEAEARAIGLRQSEVLERLGRWIDARTLLAEMAGDDPAVLRRLLDVDVAAEQWDYAADDCQRLLAASDIPDLCELALRLADLCERAGRPEDATLALERAHDVDSSRPEVLDKLRALYLRAGAYRDLANRLFADAQRTTDEQRKFERLLEVGQLRLDHLGESAKAIGPLSDALALRPGHLQTTLLLADAFSGAGLAEDAEALLEASIAPHSGRRSKDLAELQRRMARVVGKRDQAAGLKWLVQALEANPKSPEVAEELAQLGIELAEYDVAVRALRILTGKDFDPQVRARAYLGQAEIAMLQDNKARALVLARKAQTESPELAEVGALLRKLGRA